MRTGRWIGLPVTVFFLWTPPGWVLADPSAENAGLAQATSLQDALQAKHAAMSKMGLGLAELYQDYQTHIASAAQTAFPSSPSPMHVMNMGGSGMGVLIETSSETPEHLQDELGTLGLQHGERYGRMVSGWLPIASIPQAAQIADLRFARPVMFARNVGKAQTQGDHALKADTVRQRFNVDGASVTVGVLSDSYNCLGTAQADVDSGELPADVAIIDDLSPQECPDIGGTDEGRAMLQIVADIAPRAKLAFNTALHGQAGFANGILKLAQQAGASVIVDDILFLAEPMFQDGIVAQAVNRVVKEEGAAYFSAAGNNGRGSYEAPFRDSGVAGEFGDVSRRHAFNAKGDTRMRVSIPGGESVSIVLQWDQPYFSLGGSGATTDLDIYLYAKDGKTVVASAVTPNVGIDPVEILTYTNPSDKAAEYQIGIDLFRDPAMPRSPDPGLLKFVYQGNMRIEEFNTRSPTTYGHGNAEGAEAVGAAAYFNTPEFGVSPPRLQPFSSAGGVPILFDEKGNRLATPIKRLKPEIVAADAGDTSFFGSPDLDDTGFMNFFGTSAAAPHAAGVAALMRAHAPQAKPADLDAALESTAIDMRTPGFDFDSGYGLIDAEAAVEALDRASGRIALIPSTIDFSQVQQGEPAARNVIVTNRGGTPLNVGALAASDPVAAPYAISSNNCSGKTLAPRTSCIFTVSFSPRGNGVFSDSLDVSSSDPLQASASLLLTGIGAEHAAPRATLEPGKNLEFDQALVNEPRSQTLSIRNDGAAPLDLSSISVEGDAAGEFAPSGECPSMAPGESCEISVIFTPRATGARSANLHMVFSSAGRSASGSLALNGTGVTESVATAGIADTLSLGDVAVGDSHARTLPVFNRGVERLTIDSSRIEGPDAADYSSTTTCGFALPTGAGCFLTLRLTPRAAGPRMAELVISTNDPVQPQVQVKLDGSGGSDGDGISDAIEDAAPGGDGNGDGIPDREQDNVASFMARNGAMLTLAAPEGTHIRDLGTEDAPDGLPAFLNFERGFIRFTLEGVGSGPVPVQLILSSGGKVASYYIRGPEATDAVPHNYDFTAALKRIDANQPAIAGNRITLSFQDGGPGDADGLKDGKIRSFGGPATARGGGGTMDLVSFSAALLVLRKRNTPMAPEDPSL